MVFDVQIIKNPTERNKIFDVKFKHLCVVSLPVDAAISAKLRGCITAAYKSLLDTEGCKGSNECIS